MIGLGEVGGDMCHLQPRQQSICRQRLACGLGQVPGGVFVNIVCLSFFLAMCGIP